MNLLSTPLFVMKQKDEKEAIKREILEMASKLKTLNCEEVTLPVQEVVAEKSKPVTMHKSSIETTAPVKPDKKPDAILDPTPIQPEITAKEKQKKQSESVICIIEEEWNNELQRLKNSGNFLLTIDMYLTNYKRVPKHVVDQRGPSFDVKKANTY